MSEIWKDVVGYEGLYMVSNKGRVKSLDRVVQRRNNVPQKRKGAIRKQAYDLKGYKRVGLSKNAKDSTKKVHRLVCEAFIPNPNNYPQVNHKNCKKDDNRVENLEWCDNSQNQIHAFKHGLNKAKKGVNHSMSKFKEQDVLNIRKLHSEADYQMAELARIYRVHPKAIHNIVYRKTYKNI